MPSDTWIEYCNDHHIFFMIVEYKFSKINALRVDIDCIKMYNSRDEWYHVFDFQNDNFSINSNNYVNFIESIYKRLGLNRTNINHMTIADICSIARCSHTQIECPVNEYYIMAPSVLYDKLKNSGLDQLYIHHD